VLTDIRPELYNHFGFSTFRAGQKDAIRSLVIPPPSTTKCYDPNQPPFDPSEFLGDMDDDDDY